MPLLIPSKPLTRYARSGFLSPTCRGNLCTPSSGQGKRPFCRKSTSLCPIPSDAPPTLARFARSGALHSLRTVPHRLRRQGSGGRSTADNAALMRPPTPCRLQPCSTLSGCRPAGGKPPARLRVLSVLARFARSQAPLRLVLRAAVRLRLSVGLLPTGSKSLAFRAVCSRPTLPQCVDMFMPSPAPCGGRAVAGAPAPLSRPYGLPVRRCGQRAPAP